ncbi:MAG: hypothetical protein KME08_10965 [Aphanothece sp. CMT-3BRIN-NPC111]|nr:hypothetical protein [Aphanothece sp. CMT-3BRIN-NPC111]
MRCEEYPSLKELATNFTLPIFNGYSLVKTPPLWTVLFYFFPLSRISRIYRVRPNCFSVAWRTRRIRLTSEESLNSSVSVYLVDYFYHAARVPFARALLRGHFAAEEGHAGCVQ